MAPEGESDKSCGRKVYKYEDIFEGKPQVCTVKLLGLEGSCKDEELKFDRLHPEAVQVEAVEKSEKEVVLAMMADLAADTAVVLGYKTKIKLQLEDELIAQNLEWECYKKKNENWKQILAQQKTESKEGKEEKQTETPGKGKKRQGGKVETPKNRSSKKTNIETPKSSSSKKTKDVEVKKKIVAELPKSPRKEGSVMHPFFRLPNINVSIVKQ